MKIRIAVLILSLSFSPVMAKPTPNNSQATIVEQTQPPQQAAQPQTFWQKIKAHDTHGQIHHYPDHPSGPSIMMNYPENNSANNFQ